jgi:hypothetical protein
MACGKGSSPTCVMTSPTSTGKPLGFIETTYNVYGRGTEFETACRKLTINAHNDTEPAISEIEQMSFED